MNVGELLRHPSEAGAIVKKEVVMQFVRHPSRVVALAKKEISVHRKLHGEVEATLLAMRERSREFAKRSEKAWGCAVFPSVARASAVLGASYGLGEVYEHRHLVGYSGLVQLSVGVQVGGQTFSEVLLFDDQAALKRFQKNRIHAVASASAVLIKAGGTGTAQGSRRGTARARSNGGLLLEASVGLQKFVYAPAVLTRPTHLSKAARH